MKIEYEVKKIVLGIMLSAGIANIGAANYTPENVSVSLKVPGNDAKHYSLTLRKVQDGVYDCQPSENLPLVITRQVTEKDGKQRINVVIKALENVYFNYGEQIKPVISMMTVSSICPVSGIVVTCVRPKRRLHSILRIVGWCARTV